jgi:hypothetical protein
MKKLLLAAALSCAPMLAFAQTYPSPTFNSVTLQTPLASSGGGTGVNNGTNTVTLGGNLATSGAFPLTLTTTGATTVTLPTSGTLLNSTTGATAGANANITSLTGLGGGLLSIEATNTGTSSLGLVSATDPSWTPASALGAYTQNSYFNTNIAATGLIGGTSSQRWYTTNNAHFTSITTTGPTGTPTTPTGMADSHTLAYSAYETIPAGLCDGQNGSGFTGANGSPGNDCYQELGGFENAATILSPGHYSEGIGSYFYDNSGGSGAVPARAVGYTAVMDKDYAGNTYNTWGYEANSTGTQQTTDAPTSAYHVDGGWINGLDLSGGTFASADILFPSGSYIYNIGSELYFNIGGTPAWNASTYGVSFYLPISPSQTGGIVGTTTNNNAQAGSVGEFISSGVPLGSAVSLTTATPANITSISLTAGDWDCRGTAAFNPSSAAQAFQGWINTASAAVPSVASGFGVDSEEATSAIFLGEELPIAGTRISVASTTTVYLSAQSTFSTGTVGAYGFIGCRRVR